MTSGGGVYGGRPVGVNVSCGLRRSVSQSACVRAMHVVKRKREEDSGEADSMRYKTRHYTTRHARLQTTHSGSSLDFASSPPPGLLCSIDFDLALDPLGPGAASPSREEDMLRGSTR
jgi:hypothetical protein